MNQIQFNAQTFFQSQNYYFLFHELRSKIIMKKKNTNAQADKIRNMT